MSHPIITEWVNALEGTIAQLQSDLRLRHVPFHTVSFK